MRLPLQAFETAVVGYYTEAVMPALTGGTAWIAAGALPLLLPRLRSILHATGIATADGVDIEAVEAFINSAFKAQPALNVPIINLTFTAEDGAALLARLRPPTEKPPHVHHAGGNT
jgi:hypothetical protein